MINAIFTPAMCLFNCCSTQLILNGLSSLFIKGYWVKSISRSRCIMFAVNLHSAEDVALFTLPLKLFNLEGFVLEKSMPCVKILKYVSLYVLLCNLSSY